MVQNLDPNVVGYKKVNDQPNTFLILKKEITTEKLFPNWKTKMVKLFWTKNKFS